MREKVALLLIIGVVAAASVFNSQQQRTCTAPLSSVPDSASDDEDGKPWTGEHAIYRKAIWRSLH